MQTNLAVIAIAVLVLTVNAASARHRATAQPHLRHLPGAFGPAYGVVPHQAPRSPSSRDIYQSDSGERQWYPNPDRDYGGQNARNPI